MDLMRSDRTSLGMSSFLRPSGQQSESHNEGSPDEMADVQMKRNREGMLNDDAEGEIRVEDGSRSTVGSPDSPLQPITPEEYDHLVHPLQAVADRVGREAERFAEQLERLTSRQGDDQSKRYGLALELVGQYEGIAKGSVLRLRELHAPQQRTLFADYWKRKRKAPGTGQDVRLSEADLENAMPDSREYDGPPETTLADLWYWRHEQQTWTLLRRLLEFQCPKPVPGADDEKRRRLDALGHVHRYSPERKVWARFLIDDDLARERQTVVTWLQESAEISGNDVEIMTGQLDSVVEDGSATWAQGWTDTREAIKAQKRLRSWSRILDPSSPGLAASHVNVDRTESLVTQLDPDAVTRERRALEHPDRLYERFIWMTCWQMLRRGRTWSEVQEWCREKSEAWRALSLRGATHTLQLPDREDALSSLIHRCLGRHQGEDYNDDDDAAPRPQVQGDHYGPLWRRMCYALARDGGVDPWERAVYGVLGGDLISLQAVGSSWDDVIYAHYNSLVLGQYDTYLQTHYPERLPPGLARKFGRFDSVQYHGEAEVVGGRLVEQLKTHESTVREAHESMKSIQGALIAKTFKQFARQQGFALSKSANAEERSKIIPTLEEMSEEGMDTGLVNLDDLDGVRVLCHMLFIFVDLGMDLGFGNELIAFENIVVAYIDFLRLSGKISMVPLYASRLSRLRQLHTLGLVLLDIPSPRRRTELVSLMQGYRIDVYQVIRSQMRYLFDQSGLNRPLDDLVDDAPLEIMEDSTAVIYMGREIQRDFLGQEYTEHEGALVSSFEWFLYLDGYWAETFEAGVSLYTRFYLTKRLRAARGLARFMSTARISYAKTEALLGESIDVVEDGWLVDDDSRRTSFSEPQGHMSSSTAAGAGSGNRPELTRRVLASQAKVYRELEGLIRVLCAFQDWRVVIDQQPTHVDLRRATSWKTEVQRCYDEVVNQIRPLLHGWLLDVPKHQAKTCNLIRSIYLPEILLGYVNVMYTAGHVLSRDVLLECMNLSTVVAAPQSDLLPCLLDTARLPDLVAAFAVVSRAILRAEEQRGGGGLLLNGGSIGVSGGRGKALRRRQTGKSGNKGGDGDGVGEATNPSAAATAATAAASTITTTAITTTTTATAWTSSRKRRGKMENMNLWHVQPS